MKHLFIIAFTLTITSYVTAQQMVAGRVSDKKDNSALIGVNIVALKTNDSSFVKGTATDDRGIFRLDIPSGAYIIKASYLGYKDVFVNIEVANQPIRLGNISMNEDIRELKNVVIEQTATRATQKGDTTEFNSNAYKTNPDANAEDLVAKMPGMSVENGTVKAKGEDVKRVLVDGKPFFGNDPTAAMKNLPAEIIDKVQVFDRGSDQSRFTGFSDGNEERTINIITKPGKNNGVFGKIYAGYGYLDAHRYSAGANINWFNGNRRISILGMSNNINQQNFAIDDIIGLSGGGSGGGMRRGAMMAAGRGNMNMMMNSSIGNFLVGQQGGISTTNAVGINMSDQWGNKVKFTGSYFFNQTNNVNSSSTARNFFAQTETTTSYNESSESENKNINHRINLRFEYAIDSSNALFITPKLTIQQNKQNNLVSSNNQLTNGTLLSSLSSTLLSSNTGYNFSTNILYQHKFQKAGRTISIDATGTTNNTQASSNLNSINAFTSNNNTILLNQNAVSTSYNYTITGNLAYTEPVGELGQMQFNYTPAYTWNNRDKETFDADTLSGAYTEFNSTLSSNFNNNYMTHKVGFSYRIKDKAEKINFSIGTNLQYALLTGKQISPTPFDVNRNFNNILPNASLTYKITSTANLRFNYSTVTNPPSVNQLQNVIDNSNPLLLSTGNPLLKQNYQHNMRLHLSNINTSNMHMFFSFISMSYTQNYIGNATLIAVKDTMLADGVKLNTGAQLTKPVNLNGNVNLRSFFTYGLPIKKIKCNINTNVGFSYNRNPSLINNEQNLSNTFNISGGMVLSSNISEKIDFSIMYNANYSIIKNSIQSQNNNNFFFHNAELKFNWMFWKGFVFNTTVSNTLYTGIGNNFNQNFFLWNASLGYKFLKDKSLEVKASVFDILGQNNSVSRTVNDFYTEDVRTQVLQRYVMLTITYNLRYFKKQ